MMHPETRVRDPARRLLTPRVVVAILVADWLVQRLR